MAVADPPPHPSPGRFHLRLIAAGSLPPGVLLPEVDGPLGDDPSVWRLVFEASPLAWSLLDLRTGDLWANRVYRELFGHPIDGTLSLADVRRLARPGELATVDRWLDTLRSGALDGVESDRRYRRADGSAFWGRVRAMVLRDVAGSPAAVLGVLEDITARVELDAARAASEDRFRALVQHALDAVVILDADATPRYASPAALALTGASESDLSGDLLRFVHPDERFVVARAFGAVVEGTVTTAPLRLRVVTRTGAVRAVDAVATNLLDDPAVRGVVVRLRAVDPPEGRADALELADRRYRRLLENVSDTVAIIGAEGDVLATTGNVGSVLGFAPDFWVDRNVLDLIHPADVDRVRRNLGVLLRTPGGETTGEARVRNAEGDYIHAEISAVNLLDDPDVGGVVVTTRNITARKRFEDELAEARDQAVRALEMRTEFVANVSHELRTPIHGILGLTELLAHHDLPPDASDLVRSIEKVTQVLGMVLDDILDYTRIEVGRLELEEAAVSLPDLLGEIQALFTLQAQRRGLSFTIRASGELPEWVVADGLRLRQVLTNLVGNAVKFTADGEVVLDVAAAGDAERPAVRFTVTDTGVGIPPDALARIFEPFSQAHRTTARQYGGTGLGLSIARQLVELMGGELLVDSTPGEGSRFWFDLPLRLGARTAGHDLRRRPARSGPPTVLVVEDNEVNQLLVRRQLERLGCEALVVSTGVEVLERFAALDVDLVLMDRRLPVLDGLDTTRRWRALEAESGRAPVPIVAMTASALPGDRERCLAAGMDDFVSKPVALATLADLLDRWRDPGTLAGLGPAAAVDAALERLDDELGDPALVATVVRTYLHELGPRVDALTTALEVDDRAALSAAAHTLKSTSAALGVTEVAELCLGLEKAASASSVVALPCGAPDLHQAVARARPALERALAARERSQVAGAQPSSR